MQEKTAGLNAKTQYTNDLSLLRPFDLEAAKGGEDICWSNLHNPVIFVGATNSGKVAYDSEGETGFSSSESFRMKPLCWIEGKPVYKGDVVWHTVCRELIVSGIAPFDRPSLSKEGDNQRGYNIDHLTWNKPKQKVTRKIWINVYSTTAASDSSGCWFFSEQEASLLASSDRIDCVEVELSFEV